jgi:hypothetical protein
MTLTEPSFATLFWFTGFDPSEQNGGTGFKPAGIV